MQASEPLRGLIFDKDGTLFDFQASWGSWCAGFIRDLTGGDAAQGRALAEALAYDPSTRRFYPESAVIAGTMDVIVEAIRQVMPHLETTALRAYVSDAAAKAEQIPATPLGPLLDRLRDAGLTLGLATNDGEAPARAHLRAAGIHDRFAFVAGYDSGFGAKPQTGMLDAFCRTTGIGPQACAMIGDSTHDLLSGRAAGMRTVGVLTGPATAADLAPHADIVLADIAHLPHWLGLVPA